MLKNLHLKLIAVALATVFWILVVSLENTFFLLPAPVRLQVFNQAEGLALASKLGEVRLTLRMQDSVPQQSLAASDFEAYVDLKNVGAGSHRLPVSVASKNAQVGIVRVEPKEVTVILEPVRTKTVFLELEVAGKPAPGFRVASAVPAQQTVSVSGAENQLKKIASVKVLLKLTGQEKEDFSRDLAVAFYDHDQNSLEALKLPYPEVEVRVRIVETEAVKQVGIVPRFTSEPGAAPIKKVWIEPSIISVTGKREVLEKIDAIDTEPLKLADWQGDGARSARVIFPEGVGLKNGEEGKVKVHVEFQKLENNEKPPT
ncbi:hypothetical protein HYV58_00590 [Candidatus Peregrinibacteria bacterium]|nr:hypothetical protein [Candidatus Peregrinibacteria bacterium]